MASMRSIAATLFGAAVANLLPGLFGTSGVTAAWMWPAGTPKCVSAAPDMWDFDGQTTLAAGLSATVNCKNGGNATVAMVSCPSSNETGLLKLSFHNSNTI